MKALFIFTMVLVPFFGFSQDTDSEDMKGLAKVDKIEGFDIYMFSEPLAEYEVIETMTSTTGALASLAESNIDIKDIVSGIVNKAGKKNRKAAKKNEPLIEAIIIYNNERAAGIRYVDE